MGKLQKFVVSVDNPSAVYFPGQTVSGYVDVELSESMTVRGIRLKVYGRAFVWTTTHKESKANTHTTGHQAEEVYVNNTLMLVGSADSDSRMTLQAGSYRYPFRADLPNNLPSSFEGGTGHVRYIVQATIDKPWKFDHVTCSAFTVVGIVDLNAQALQLRQPYVKNLDGRVSCCCWVGGNVNVTLRLNRCCFVPGETIYIDAEVVNSTTSDVTAVKAHLVQINTFHAGVTMRRDEGDIAVIDRHEVIRPGGNSVWNKVAICIPPVPPTKLGGCRIIDVEYVLRFDISAKCTTVHVPTEITIGSIPLQYENVAAQPLDFPTISQPSYEDCIGGPVSIKENGDSSYVLGNLTWAPKYPYYGQQNAAVSQ
jgi:hypothetical protein